MRQRLQTLSEKYFFVPVHCKKNSKKGDKIVDNFLTVRDKKSKHKIRYFLNK